VAENLRQAKVQLQGFLEAEMDVDGTRQPVAKLRAEVIHGDRAERLLAFDLGRHGFLRLLQVFTLQRLLHPLPRHQPWPQVHPTGPVPGGWSEVRHVPLVSDRKHPQPEKRVAFQGSVGETAVPPVVCGASTLSPGGIILVSIPRNATSAALAWRFVTPKLRAPGVSAQIH